MSMRNASITRPGFFVRTTVCTTFLCALSAGVATAQPAARTVTAAAPSIISLERDGEPMEVASLGGMRITKSGSVLFADTKPVTVWVREGRAGSIRQVARAGAGPAEYRSAPQFIGYRADSIAAYDASLQRWSLLVPDGSFARVLATGADAAALAVRAVWVADGAIVLNASLESVRPPLAESIRQVLASSGTVRPPLVIRQADNGDLWVASQFSAKSWIVFDRAGRKRTAYEFPTPFRFEHANDTVALGRTIDADDLPQIMRIPIRAQASAKGPVVATAMRAVTPAERSEAKLTLTAILRRMVGNQEGAYAEGRQYTTSVEQLKLDIPSTIEVSILEANNRGWVAVARMKHIGVTCAMTVGYSIIGWNEAIPYCS